MIDNRWIKTGLIQHGRTQKELAETMGIHYTELSKIINNFQHEPLDFSRRVQAVFAQWQAEKAQSISSKISAVRAMTAGRIQG
jgi:plasmid maintenance system antidote protein VapI